MKWEDYAIVSDFDGTITTEDTNVLLFRERGNAENAQIEIDFIAGRLPNREAMARHFRALHLSLEEYHAFLDQHIQIDAGFDAFWRRARAAGLPLFIISAGYKRGVERVLGVERLQDVTIFANDLSGSPHLTPTFARETNCAKPYGPCGNCKQSCLVEIRQETGRKLIYIGDGLTDRCAIAEADLLFAKGALAAHCQSENLPYVPFETFADIEAHLWPDGGAR